MAYESDPWPSLEPGQLRHQIQIQSQSSTPDGFGQPQQTWTTILTTWSRIQAISERELMQSNQLTSQVTHTVTTRFNSSVTILAGMRILYGSHTYKVQGFNNVDERNVILKILVLELNGAQ